MTVDEGKTECKVTLVTTADEVVTGKNEEGSVSTGMKVDEFLIQSLIGRGGASEVYRAHDTRTDTIVALKFLLASRLTDKQSCARLRSEAKHIMGLRHRSIVSVLDVRESDSVGPYLVMELVEGKPLTEYLPLSQQQALEVCVQVAEALSYAHGTGMIHRDIKPSNVMMLANGSVCLVDFGLAKVFAQENPEHMPLTRTTEVVGTPLYMSPEQCFGQDLSVTSDIYQLGCLLFQSITGFPPFEGSTSFEAMYKHVSAQPDLRGMPPPVRDILNKALDKNPDERFQTAGEMGQCLRDAIEGRSTAGRKTKMVIFSKMAIVGIATMLIAGTAIFLQLQKSLMPSQPPLNVNSLTASQIQAQYLYEQGLDCKAKGWTEKARESLTQAIALDKGTIGFRALSYLRAKLPAHVQSTDAEQLNILGYNLGYSRRESEAEKVWKQCIAKYPNFEWPYSNLASQYMQQGHLQKALPLLERAIEINPYYTNALRNMSDVQSRLAHRDLAIKYMKQAAESAPEDPSYASEVSALEAH